MALTATIYNIDIDLADADRGVYETLALRVAQHPSESEAYLVTRVLAYALEYTEGIEFSAGLSNADLPAILVRDLAEAIEVANLYAPEHMQLATADDEAILAEIVHAGEVLLGQHTPFSAGNYLIGIPATLPTSGYARVTSGVTAAAFTKTISIARASEDALAVMAPDILALADHEDFPAHGNVIRERFGT